MDGAPAAVRWRPPPIPGIPVDLQQRAEVLQGAYVNSGRMSGALARLQMVALLVSQTSKRNSKGFDGSRRSITRTLAAMHSEVLNSFVTSRTRMDADLAEFKTKMDQRFSNAEEDVERRVQGGIHAVEASLTKTDDEDETELLEALESLKQCGADLERDINSTETDYMTSLAQMTVFSSWSSAWPLAMRCAVEDAREAPASSAPPHYAFTSGNRNIDQGVGARQGGG
ncbi:hypothetical protein CF319_g5364 [Tilletia indica]|nr:hypothetical protein CF319_g5364 [Tilletia indica]